MDKHLEKQILRYLRKKSGTREKIIKKLKIKGRTNKAKIEETLYKMETEGKIFLDEKNTFHVFGSNIPYIQGKIFINIDGSGYFKGEKFGKTYKFVIPHEHLNGALSGDTVVVKDYNRKKYDRKMGAIIKVVERDERPQIFEYMGMGFFRLYNGSSNVYLYKREKDCLDVVEGSLVLGRVDRNPIFGHIYTGETESVLGHINDPKDIVRIVGYKYGFDYNFNDKIMDEAKSLPLKVSEEDIKDRVDLREEKVFTIDGADTKDIDDAISISKDKDGYILKVHIADVSHYLKGKDNLIKTALERGNSAYLVDSVFPMLPHLLSNGICSLNPYEDRLTKTVEMKIDNSGNIVSSKVYKSVINSKKKMNYNNVNTVLEGKKVVGYERFEYDLHLMNKLAKLLQKNRISNGALEFPNQELKLYSDLKGKILDVDTRNYGEGEKLIENFMVAANIEVTKHFGYLDNPFIYRVHPEPRVNSLLFALNKMKSLEFFTNENKENLNNCIESLEKTAKNDNKKIDSKAILKFLDSIKHEEYYGFISEMILKCMDRAYYSNENIGHFALASNSYSHFTSPIRRAADLVNHFIIDLIIEYYNLPTQKRSKEIEEEMFTIGKNLPKICEHITETEWLAEKAETEAEKIKLAEYFQDHIEEYDGPLLSKIKYINKFGIFAQFDIFNVFIPKIELLRNGFDYKRMSRTYVSKEEKLAIGDDVYLFYPEVSLENAMINFNDISKDPHNLIAKEKPKTFIKSKKINPL